MTGGVSKRLAVFGMAILRETIGVYWTLVKIMLPVMVLTQLAIEAGLIKAISPAFAPIMHLVGLPPEAGFVWAMNLLVGVWSGAVVMFAVLPVDTLTAAQVTVLGSLFLFAHALPIEQRIVQKAGPRFIVSTLIRLGGGLVFAWGINLISSRTGWLTEPVAPSWVPGHYDSSWSGFVTDTASTLIWIFVVLLGLVAVLKTMDALDMTRFLNMLLSPLLRFLGIARDAAPLTVVGLVLGLSYGGGLIIREAQRGHLPPRDVFLASSFMGLCHSLIEDTLIVVALGANIYVVLFGRLFFSVVLIAILARLLRRTSDTVFFRFLYQNALHRKSQPRYGATAEQPIDP
ncbi:nucleoside recognition protein [Ochrobactrum sp. CM-21-5]|nr:nucleoside recognition protein [Ochrobactrum sp. CM-21-5]MBC2887350.1 nucleoside recognition protein [Ochrobactrum sp. CM-21-5]